MPEQEYSVLLLSLYLYMLIKGKGGLFMKICNISENLQKAFRAGKYLLFLATCPWFSQKATSPFYCGSLASPLLRFFSTINSFPCYV